MIFKALTFICSFYGIVILNIECGLYFLPQAAVFKWINIINTIFYIKQGVLNE